MPEYKYSAIDRNGAQTSGKIEAASDEQARQKLMARGLMVTTLASDGG
ncbi:MAG: type II secretion system F family protein, partial [Verrucomicrobia bacterium]|nr:type II secretion system F family protein [Verrucomicrobiota bacterium]